MLSPVDGSTDHFYLDPIEFSLSAPDASASIAVSDGGGAAVAGSTRLSDDGLTVSFVPDGGLAPSTPYGASLSVCDGAVSGSIRFTTSGLGAPVTVDLTGETYVVDLGTARFVQPAGVADLLLGSLENNILVGVISVDGSTLNMLGAVDDGAGGGQDYCSPSIPYAPAAFDDPSFQVGPADAVLTVAGVDITLFGSRLRGAFASDGSYFGGGRLEGQLDARDLAPLLGDLVGVTDPDAVCSLLAGFGAGCEACGSDGAGYCLAVLADQITATASGAPLVCVDEVACHPGCSDNTCGDPALGECR